MAGNYKDRRLTVGELIERLKRYDVKAYIAIPQNRPETRASIVVNTHARVLVYDHAGGELVNPSKPHDKKYWYYSHDQVVLLTAEDAIGDEKPWEYD